ncbi:phage tail protein [Martelella lutilitoris]|uniref:Phage tail protein n=1 Tax=Martelella lutilitoris TaxID=2583532 RepID=A0A7T7HMG9_9HYPH|nr:phage tail protein [Martelella lutilitoris]QQM31737.1 phage tail protein [Martelella lutilitoris]
MADRFEPPKCPSVQSTRETEFRVLESSFGDGYSQRSGAGLNAEGLTFNAVWSSLSISQADQIEAFFRSLRGFHAFEWKAPRDKAARLYRCKSWTRGFLGSGRDTITAKIERVYDL